MPRPKEFDPEIALRKAVEVFWHRGYEAASVSDLVAAMGINRFSLYNTFGGKQDLFHKALDCYRDDIITGWLAVLEQPGAGVEAIRKYFEVSVEAVLSKQGSRGCLMTNSMIELGPHHSGTRRKLKAHLDRMERAFYNAILAGKENGEITRDQDPRALARYLVGCSQGLGVMAKVSPDRKTLKDYVSVILSALR